MIIDNNFDEAYVFATALSYFLAAVHIHQNLLVLVQNHGDGFCEINMIFIIVIISDFPWLKGQPHKTFYLLVFS
jgi:hypothetical protein